MGKFVDYSCGTLGVIAVLGLVTFAAYWGFIAFTTMPSEEDLALERQAALVESTKTNFGTIVSDGVVSVVAYHSTYKDGMTEGITVKLDNGEIISIMLKECEPQDLQSYSLKSGERVLCKTIPREFHSSQSLDWVLAAN